MSFRGAISALVTPFVKNEIDYESLDRIIDYQLVGGINGLVINGTTAEAPTLTFKEVQKIFSFTKEKVKGRIPIILGVGSNSTQASLDQIDEVKSWGAEGYLIVTPYYNRPSQEGLFQHYKILAEKSDRPIIVYNVPKRTGVSLDSQTVQRLSSIDKIVGIKEASGDLELGKEIISKTPDNFLVLSGDDESCLSLAKLGGNGVISVISNLLPKEMSEAFAALGKKQNPLKEHINLIDQGNSLLRMDINPVAIKEILFARGLIRSSEVRLPLVSMSESKRELVKIKADSLGTL